MFEEHIGACLERRSGGEHIVNQHHSPGDYRGHVPDVECARHIRRPFGSAETHLVRRVSHATHAIPEFQSAQFGQRLSKHRRLIESPLPDALFVERDRNQRSRIVDVLKRRQRDTGEVADPAWFALILDQMNGLAQPPFVRAR